MLRLTLLRNFRYSILGNIFPAGPAILAWDVHDVNDMTIEMAAHAQVGHRHSRFSTPHASLRHHPSHTKVHECAFQYLSTVAFENLAVHSVCMECSSVYISVPQLSPNHFPSITVSSFLPLLAMQ